MSPLGSRSPSACRTGAFVPGTGAGDEAATAGAAVGSADGSALGLPFGTFVRSSSRRSSSTLALSVEGGPMLIRSLGRACTGGGVGAGAGVRCAGGGASCRSNSREGMKICSLTGPTLATGSLTFSRFVTRLMSAIMIIKCTITDIRKPWRWSKRPMANSVPESDNKP